MTKYLTNSIEYITSGELKMADLINIDYRLLSVLYRLGINMGFGDESVAEICNKHNINPSSFMLICNTYIYEGYIPSDDFMLSADPKDIITYLHNSHSYYILTELNTIENYINDLVTPCEATRKNIIVNFFSQYRTEVTNHFEYEESIVFPYIKTISSDDHVKEYRIGKFEESHSNIDEKLNDLRNILMKYLPSVCDSLLAIKVLSHLYKLEYDLKKHTSIENNILIPLVNKLENNDN